MHLWATLHTSYLHCILRSYPAPYWAEFLPSELPCTLRASKHPAEQRCTVTCELHCTLLTYTASFGVTLHPTELSSSPLSYPAPSEQVSTLLSNAAPAHAGLYGIWAVWYWDEKKCRCRNQSRTEISRHSVCYRNSPLLDWADECRNTHSWASTSALGFLVFLQHKIWKFLQPANGNQKPRISQKFADLWLRIKPKILQILQKTFGQPTFANLPPVSMIPAAPYTLKWSWRNKFIYMLTLLPKGVQTK